MDYKLINKLKESIYFVRAIGPLPISLDDPNKFTGEPESSDGEPIDVGTRLQIISLCNPLNKEIIKVIILEKSLTKPNLYRFFIGIKILAVIRMNVSFLPIQLVVHNLVHVRIGKFNVVGIRIDEMTKVEPIIQIHEEASLSISPSESHFRIQIGILVGRSGRLVCYNSRVDQVAVTDEWHVPQSPETDVLT